MTIDAPISPAEEQRQRSVQQDARAWAKFTGTKYTSALRQIEHPLAQGLIGEPIGARDLIAVLEQHPIVGRASGSPHLGEAGGDGDGVWSFNGETDFIQLARLIDLLRIFTPTAEASDDSPGSYSMKHATEDLFARYDNGLDSYVSNGRLIWAAAALGLPMSDRSDTARNLYIGIDPQEFSYVYDAVRDGRPAPKAHHNRPAAFKFLLEAYSAHATGHALPVRWDASAVLPEPAPFHDWFIEQAGRRDAVGDLARDYTAGLRANSNRIAHLGDEMVAIVEEEVGYGPARDAAVEARREWVLQYPPAQLRTEQISGMHDGSEGFGAGSGDVERYNFYCPCGEGQIAEEHDNIPGFREHDVRILCATCREEWDFVPNRSVRDWALYPIA